jgi:hypothetical protein
VGEAAIFLGEGAGGQNYVSQIAGFGQENVLHHQVVQSGQRVAGVVGIGVGHGGVFAHHVQAFHVACEYGFHHFHHREAGLVVQRACGDFP